MINPSEPIGGVASLHRTSFSVLRVCLFSMAMAFSFFATEKASGADENEDGRVRLYVRAEAPTGGKLFFKWSQLEGPPVTIADPAAGQAVTVNGKEKWVSDTYFIPTEPGKYVFEVSVKNENDEESKTNFVQEVLPAAPPPLASAGRDQPEKLIDEIVVVNGSESKAAPGRAIAKWQWQVLDAPPGFKLDPKQLLERKFEFKAKNPGAYKFELKVFDGKRWSDPSKVTITVLEPIPPPVANAGRNQSDIVAGETVTLDGSLSSAAPKRAIVEWEWKIVQAPDKFAIDSKRLKEPKFDFKAAAPGTYKFALKVFDSKHWSEPSEVSVTVVPPLPPPTAEAGKDQESKLVGEPVVINGSTSHSADGRPLKEFEWKVLQAPEKFKLSITSAREPKFDFVARDPGVYEFQLRVFDGKHWSEPAHTRATVKRPSQKPIVETDTPPAVELPLKPEDRISLKKAEAIAAKGGMLKLGETIVLDGSQSIADEGNHPEFFWKQKKEPLIKELKPDMTKPYSRARTDAMNYPVWTCVPSEPGEYSFVLELATSLPTKPGEPPKFTKTESEPVVFTIVGPKTATPKLEPEIPVAVAPKNGPVAKLFAERKEVEAGDMVKLDGSKSTDPNNAKLTYIWAPVPGQRFPKTFAGKDGPIVEFKAEEEGQYGVALVVDNGTAKSEPAQVVVNVGSANQPPVIKLKDSFECVTGEELHIPAEVSDPENDRLELKWSCIDPKDLHIPDSLAKKSELIFKPRETGTYVFKLSATDAKGHTVTAQTMVGVKAPINRPPTAVINAPKGVNTGTKVVISGVKSSDPEKQPLIYMWKQENDKPKIPGEVPGEHDKTWEFTPTEPGNYVVSLVVSDGVNKSEPDKIELVVSTRNAPPVANILPPPGGKVMVDESVVLDGSASSDPDNDKLTFKWRKVEGKGEIGLDGIDKDKVSVKGIAPGVVKIELIVNDGKVDSEPAVIDLRVAKPGQKPVAMIEGPVTASLGALVELNGEKSNDPDGSPISFIWAQGPEGGPDIKVRGTELRMPKVTFKADRAGKYVLTLEIINTDGVKSDPATHTVEVKGVIHPPKCLASVVDKGPILINSEVKLTSRGSASTDGGKLTYKWRQLTGGKVTLPEGPTDADIVNIAPSELGKYEFECIANDGESDSAPVLVSFLVQEPHALPTAVISEVTPCEPGERITLDGSQSQDPNGNKLEYHWTQTSGAKVSFGRGDKKAKTEVVLPKEGEYSFELTVSHGKEASAPAKVSVTTRAPNVAPIAAVSNGNIRAEEGVETVLDASTSSDPDNGPKPLTFTWRQVDGTKVELKSEGAIARFTPKKAGVATFAVEAFDGKNKSPAAEIKVQVLPAGTFPVAIPKAKPNPAKIARREVKTDLSVILDGTESRPRDKPLTYTWKQISGDDLGLPAAALTRERVGLRIYHRGAYRFSLIVSDGENKSQEQFVDVTVESAEPEAPKQPDTKPSSSLKTSDDQTASAGSKSAHPDGSLLPPPKE